MAMTTPSPITTTPDAPIAWFDARVRRVIYIVYTLLTLTLGSFQVWFSSTAGATPTWLMGAIAVSAYLGGAIGVTAAVNAKDRS
jgi:uncharacterized RDD family membrane protein YckC